MESLYAQYISERLGDHVLEVENGFATYRYISDKSVYIVDIYVKPSCRKSGLAAEMADEIVRMAKVRGCAELLGSVVPSTANSTTSMKVLLGYGMSLQNSSNDFIVFRKEI